MGLKVLNFEGSSVGEASVPNVFTDSGNRHLIWEVIKAELANKRQGTHKTKTKSEVRGGGSKPWRQKGTGRARQGSIRSPQWRGGGIAFGPLPRDYSEMIPRKKKRAGLRSILAEKFSLDKVVILDSVQLSEVSTKKAVNGLMKVVENSPFYGAYSENRKLIKSENKRRRPVTLVTDSNDNNQKLSIQNIPWVKTVHVDRLSAVPLFYNHGLIITKGALDKLYEKFAK